MEIDRPAAIGRHRCALSSPVSPLCHFGHPDPVVQISTYTPQAVATGSHHLAVYHTAAVQQLPAKQVARGACFVWPKLGLADLKISARGATLLLLPLVRPHNLIVSSFEWHIKRMMQRYANIIDSIAAVAQSSPVSVICK